MLRLQRNRKAQAVMGEYVVVLSLVMAVIIGIAVYFKRAVQARIYDSRNYMVDEVRKRTQKDIHTGNMVTVGGAYDGDLYYEYEPYYVMRSGIVQRESSDQTKLLPGGTSGVFRKEFDESATIRGFSETLPPKEFNATTPQPAPTGGGSLE